MLNNLFGDFVKGRDLGKYPEKIQRGLNLHREIDDYIDHHPVVLDLQHRLYTDLPKVSGVAIDLFFDHLLAKDWRNFHSSPLDSYLQEFYSSIDVSSSVYTEEFCYMIEKMVEINWISYYPSVEGLDKMCRGVSQRISFDNQLKNGCDIFHKHEKQIVEVFKHFMGEARQKFKIE